MGKVESIIKSEIVRLAKREMKKISVPLNRDVRSLKSALSQIRRVVSTLERFRNQQAARMEGEKFRLEAAPEEVQTSRFSPRLIRRLRERLGISQRQFATLAGVTVGAVFQWEKGKFEPRDDKKATLVALRKLGRREVKQLLEEKSAERTARKVRTRRSRGRKRVSKR